ncbi:hypothetical protein SD457_03505 [Coprobacillaceae bacterium CR2/5/TPMF4]|nr:hypothetical protein SD457_03505 [Coprobacillaceae bacterium CR2/5/TPMF4]
MPTPFDTHLKYFYDVIKAIESNNLTEIIRASNAKLIKSYDSRGLFNEDNEEYKAKYNSLKTNVIKFYRDKFNDLVYDDFEEFKKVLTTSIKPLEQLVFYQKNLKSLSRI